MKLISRLFGKKPPSPPPAPPPAPAAAAPAPPVVQPEEHERLLQGVESGAFEPAELARLAVEGPTTRVRQAAAAAIGEPAQLHELLPRLRGKDKAVYKLVKQKCDALLAAERQADAAAREATALCDSLERHAARPHDVLYAPTLQALTSRWRALPADADPQLRSRGEQALARCAEVIAAHERELARQAEEQAAAQAARAARERDLLAERQTREQADAARSASAQEARAAAVAAREAEERARAEQHAAEAQAQREIASLIRLCGAALQRGDTRKAARFRAGIDEALAAAPAVPPYLARNLQQLDERLNELRQWKDYAVAPKRIELIEEMEALVGVDEEPEALAEHIRALQQEWRTINKGIAVDTSAEAERFQQAYQAAFKPCQAFFAAQAAVRRQNLEARRQVLERVRAFETSLDAEHPDYALVTQVLREAPAEWRSHGPVERDAGRALDAEFFPALDRLRAVLNAWYERNAADKQALITQARHLATSEDSGEAIEAVKRLQQRWKDSGPVAREQGQALWNEFRGLCDAVFERRQQVHAQLSATLDAARTQALALCESIEQAAADADRATAHTRIREWQAAFDEIGELPRADARALRERFERAVGRVEAGLATQDARDLAAAESNLFEAASHVRAYERAVMGNAATAEREALRHAAEDFIAGVPRWPGKGALQALRQAMSRADTGEFGADETARETALRTLCIRAEILGSKPTPAADASLRRDFEMQLLAQGLGQARQADERDWNAMRLEWVGVSAVAPALHDELERRFRHSLDTRPVARPPEAQYRDHDGSDRKPRREGRDGRDGRDGREGRGGPDSGRRR